MTTEKNDAFDELKSLRRQPFQVLDYLKAADLTYELINPDCVPLDKTFKNALIADYECLEGTDACTPYFIHEMIFSNSFERSEWDIDVDDLCMTVDVIEAVILEKRSS